MIGFKRPRAFGFAAVSCIPIPHPIGWTIAVSMILSCSTLNAECTGKAATFNDGTICHSEVRRWENYRSSGPSRSGDNAGSIESIENLVILKVLVNRYKTQGMDLLPAHKTRLTLLDWDLAGAWLRARIATAATPSESDLKASFNAEPGHYSRPRRWQLQNIFKRWPQPSTETSHTVLIREMNEIRRRVIAGEDFARLAGRESQSQTRLRGGRLGLVSLEQLQREVAVAVAQMQTGSISPVIETADGLTLLRCTRVFEAKSPTFPEVREQITKKIRRERVQEAWVSLDRRLVQEFRPSFRPDAVSPTAPETTVVATYRVNGHIQNVTLAEYRIFLARKGSVQQAESLDQARHLEWLKTRVLMEAHALEAVKNGLDTDEKFRERRRWKRLELMARIALDQWVSPMMTPPTIEELKAIYLKRHDTLIREERMHVRALELPIRLDLPRKIYLDFELLSEQLASGKITISGAAKVLEPHAIVRDFGWKTPDEIWIMGRNVEDAIKGLKTGHFTAPIQEGKTLSILYLAERRDRRILSFEEARPRLEAAIIAARRARAEDRIRRTILDHQRIEVLH